METIIGLLIVILPIVFRFVGKKLEQAAQNSAPQAEPIQDWAETLRQHMEMQPSAELSQEQGTLESASAKPAATSVKPWKTVKAGIPVNVSKPILTEEPKKEKEKVDVKKLIVYSEIMKPKYTE